MTKKLFYFSRSFNQIQWNSFKGLQSLLLKGLTCSFTFDASFNILCNLTVVTHLNIVSLHRDGMFNVVQQKIVLIQRARLVVKSLGPINRSRCLLQRYLFLYSILLPSRCFAGLDVSLRCMPTTAHLLKNRTFFWSN